MQKRKGVRGFIVQLESDGENFFPWTFGTGPGFDFRQDGPEIKVRLGQAGFERFLERLPVASVGSRLAPLIGHSEGIDDYIIVTGENIGGEDVKFGHREGSDDFGEEPGPVPGNHGDFRVVSGWPVVPTNSRGERIRINLDLGFKEFMHQLEVFGEERLVGASEVGRRKAAEMNHHLLGADVTRERGADPVNDLSPILFGAGEKLFTLAEKVAGEPIELPDEEFAPFGVGSGATGPLGIGEGEKHEHVEAFLIMDDTGELPDGLGIVQISALGEFREGHVMIDEEDQIAETTAPDFHSARKTGGELCTLLAVMFGVGGFSDIMKNQCQVENIGFVATVEKRPVFTKRVFRIVKDPVELFKALQGVLVGCVAMVKLVLDQTGQRAELGNESAQKASFVHGPNDAPDFAFFAEDIKEHGADIVEPEKFVGDFRRAFCDGLLEFRAKDDISLLHDLEGAEKTPLVFGKNGGAFRVHFPTFNEKAVNDLNSTGAFGKDLPKPGRFLDLTG